MKYDNSLEALIRPGSADHYFQFDQTPAVYLSSHQFEITNACLLAELCRLIYRTDQSIYCGDQKISFINTILNQIQIQWIDCFKNETNSVYSWLLQLTTFDTEINKSRDCLLLIFRGTNGFDNWKLNANAMQTQHPVKGNVHTGFMEAFNQIKQQISNSDDLKKQPVILAGHSLGAALAVLTKSIFENELTIDSCYTFGSPKVGNAVFSQSIKQDNIYRIINRNDAVTMLPFDFLTYEYHHVGQSHYFTGDGHYIDFLDEQIRSMQQNDLPNVKQINNIDGFLSIFKNLERDIPTYLSDHAPINYLVRLNQQRQS